jgi:hypothetical protein
MKKLIIFLLSSLILTLGASAQGSTITPLALGDTVNASSGLDTVSKIYTNTGGYQSFSLQVVSTKLSGTVSLKAYLYTSNDRVNYVLTDSSSAFVDQTTNTALFAKSPAPYAAYKVQVRPATAAATTQSVICRFWPCWKYYQPPN